MMKPLRYIVSLILTLTVVICLILAQNSARQVNTLSDSISDLKGNFEAEKRMFGKTLDTYRAQVDALTEQLKTIREQLEVNRHELDNKLDIPDRSGARVQHMTASVTCYCICVACCGKVDGITASGVKAEVGVTIAAGPDVPFGTRVYLPGFGWRTVQDRGSAIKRGCVDILVGSHAEALRWGRREMEVWILE